MGGRRRRSEEFSVSGGQVASAARALLGSVLARRVCLKTRKGRTLLPLPMALAILAVLFLPLWVLVAVLAALAAGLRIVLEGPRRVGSDGPPPAPETTAP